MNLLLFIIAWILIPPLTIWNLVVVYQKNSSTKGYFRSTEFRSNIVNITSTTQIQNADIDVVVFKSPNGTLKQRYYDDSNNLVINNL